MDNPLKPFENQFFTKGDYVAALREFTKTGTVDIAGFLKISTRYAGVVGRLKKLKLTNREEVQSDWTYNETAPAIHTTDSGSLYVITQWNGPGGPSRLVFCSDKKKAAKVLMGCGAIVIIRKPKTKKERVEAALRRIP